MKEQAENSRGNIY